MAFDILESIRLDMQNLNAVTVNAVQYDNTRRLKVQLLNGGVTWSVPSNNVKAVVSFKKSDNIGGFYDVTDLGEDAVSYDSDRSIIYIRFDVQVLTTVGNVDVQINFYQNKQRISAFAFHVNVEASVIRSNEVSSNWLFHILSKEIADTLTVATTPDAMRAWLEENIKSTVRQGAYAIDNTLTLPLYAADAEATGKMVTVSNLNPNIVANKVWVKKTPAEIQIPTVEELDEVKSALEGISKNTFLTASDLTQIDFQINTSNKWVGISSSPAEAGIYDISTYKKLIITPNDGVTSVWAFLKTSDPVRGQTPDYSDNYSSRILSNASTPREYDITDDMRYVYFASKNSSGDNIYPNKVELKQAINTDDTLTKKNVPADAKAVGDALSSLSIATDKTLSIVDKPADAKATGDNIRELSKTTDSLSTEVSQIEQMLKINEHLYEIIYREEAPFVQYGVEDGTIIPLDDSFIGTDYIPAPKYLCVNLRDTKVRVMVYFFDLIDGEYVPRWDILKLETSTHILNYLSFSGFRNRVIEIPEGVYIKICVAVEGDYSIYGWDGIHFGGEISGEVYGPYLIESSGKYTLHTFVDRNTFFTVSGKAKQIIMKNAMAISIFGRDANGNYAKLSYAGSDTPFVQVFDVPAGYEWISVSAAIGVEYDKYTNGHALQNYLNTPTNLNDYVSVVNGINTSIRPYGRAADVFDVAEKIVNIKWTNLRTTRIANDDSSTNDYNKFRLQSLYSGIPYSSEWMSVHWFGWHISKHTFLNATNDLQSKFYAETDRKGNSYGYGLVCSTFTGLCEGWPVPFVNYSMLHEPSLHYRIMNQPQIGSTTQNSIAGHCVLPESVGQNENDYDFYTIYECVSPLTLRRTNYSFKGKTGTSVRSWGYMRDFYRVYEHYDAKPGTTPYDITDGSITGGTARPYCGDRGVLTSATGVKINIYDTNATTLYLQKCTYNKSTKVFTPTGTVQSISIPSGETQITVDLTLLSDNSFYSVYTDADNTPEYFEYHVVQTETYSTNETFSFSRNDFWYICFWETDTVENRTEIIPASDNYSAYYEAYHPQGNSGTMFFKGTLGAYCTTVEYQN